MTVNTRSREIIMKPQYLYFAGILSSILINRWGCRMVLFTGGILMSAGLLLCVVAHDMYFLVVSFGLIAGGLRFTYTSQ